MVSKKKLTIKDIAETGECTCPICTSQDVVIDNFEQIGKVQFTKLALSALEVSKNEPK